MAMRTCGFCSSPGGYTCPRCSADYCGLKCYQSPEHRACSEKFYKDCVQAELVGNNLGAEGKEKMQEILKRMNREQNEEEDEDYEDDSDDDEDPVDLEERLGNINLDDTSKVWSLLSKEERKQFDELVNSGDISSVLPAYTPWWKNEIKIKKIKELHDPDVDESIKDRCPALWKEIPSLRSICQNPSENIKFGLLNLLYAYCYAVQYFQGDYSQSDGGEFVEIMQTLASNLDGQNFSLADTAVETSASEVNNHEWLAISLQHSRDVKKDVFDVVRGPTGNDNYYVLAALSDLKIIFESSLKNLKKKKKSEASQHLSDMPTTMPPWIHAVGRQPDLKYDRVKKHLKKIEFYLSWVQDCYKHAFKDL